MFDFFRDMALEVKGIDSTAVAKERKEKQEKKHKNRIIFSGGTKGIVFFFGVLYLVMNGLQMTALRGQGNITLPIVKFVFLSAIDISILVCLLIHKNRRRAEIVAIILIIIFVVVMYTTTMIL